ncbi:MAG: hypothetical protein ACK56F_19805, partial [bacterium]
MPICVKSNGIGLLTIYKSTRGTKETIVRTRTGALRTLTITSTNTPVRSFVTELGNEVQSTFGIKDTSGTIFTILGNIV